VFNFEGLGRLLVDSIQYKDVPVVQCIVLILCAIYIFCNLLADISVVTLNPKLRSAR
jgi:peptide/nickel transport system permease protein